MKHCLPNSAPLIVALAFASAAGADVPAGRLIDRETYTEHLRAMWQAQTIANWTGIRTEGSRSSDPFFTDDDWGTFPFPDRPWLAIDFELLQNPWGADDDTDIEYVYLHALSTLGENRLTPENIRDAWIQHVHHSIWVSNYAAKQLMNVGVTPPMTSLGQGLSPASPVDRALMIDAQLTTEFFGAICPGMPERALDMADLPIRTTARSYAAHAAQFYVALYALASQVNRALPARDQALWLIQEARKFIPDSSKSADVIDFVVADYMANPDPSDWESTRDKVHLRYQVNAIPNGFAYRGWFESSVNLATGVIALLYGELDLSRTIQIGTLSGWDSDNGTATMGGLIGLIRGPAAISDEGWDTVADTYWITRTRADFPDYTPALPGEDTFTLMAARMLPIIDREVEAAGGLRDPGDSTRPARWLLPPGGAGDGLTPAAALLASPTHQLFLRSANNQVRLAGGTVSCSTDVPGSPQPAYASSNINYIADGIEHDARGLEEPSFPHFFYATQRASGNPPGVEQALAVIYDRPVNVHIVRFMGCAHYLSGTQTGGWFESLRPEILVDGQWIAPALSALGAPAGVPGDPDRQFPLVDFVLATPIDATGVRVRAIGGGTGVFITCMELDALSPPVLMSPPGFDRDGDGRLAIDDLYELASSPADLNADGIADESDLRYLETALRLTEPSAMAQPQR